MTSVNVELIAAISLPFIVAAVFIVRDVVKYIQSKNEENTK